MKGGTAARLAHRTQDIGARNGFAAAQDAVRRNRPRHFLATPPTGIRHHSSPSCRKSRLRRVWGNVWALAALAWESGAQITVLLPVASP
eukprot:3937964-Alexandrium_andersonii.AAC.1